MARLSRALSLWIAAPLGLLLAGSTCGTNEPCECFPCGAAVGLTVLDEAGNALNDPWVMAATLNGDPVDDGGSCDPDFRLGNSCAFGTETGVYRVVVEAPGYQTREVAARSAVASGQDCCMGACANQAQVVVRLLPE